MSLLLTSERVFTDLHDWIKWGEPDQVVLRKWEPELTLEYLSFYFIIYIFAYILYWKILSL